MGGGCVLDSLSSSLIILTLWLTLLIALANWYAPRRGWLYSMFMLMIIALILSFTSQAILLFYFFFESSLLVIFIIIIGWGYQPERLLASLALVFYTLFASLPLLVAILSLRCQTPVFSFSGALSCGHLTPGGVRTRLSIIWLLAFVVKLPVYFVHLWLPKAHVEAPVSGSIILAGILLKLGGFGFIRVTPLIGPANTIIPLSVWRLIGGVVIRVVCLRHRDIKVLIAYSSVVHIALILVGSLTGSYWGNEGSLIIIIAHGICSSGLFAWANIAYERTHSRGLLINKGTLNISPQNSLWLFVLIVGNFGGPFTINLTGEIILIISALGVGPGLGVIVAGLSFFSAAYSLILYASTQQNSILGAGVPQKLFNCRESLVIFSHVWPIMIMCLCPLIL